jgi:sugar lactone lactonase YvrE
LKPARQATSKNKTQKLMKAKQSSRKRRPLDIGVRTLIGVIIATATLSRADTMFVSNWNNNTVERFDSFTGADLGLFAQPYHPRHIALDGAGNLYAIAWGSQSVMKYAPNGAESVFATGLQGGESLAVDAGGNVYVGNLWDNTILRFAPNGARSVFASTGDKQPDCLAFDGAGNLFVANSSANTIQKFTPDGVGSVFATGLVHPLGLAVDKTGNLFVANY